MSIHIKMDRINSFLLNECEMSEKVAKMTMSNLVRHIDLLKEFYHYVENGKYKKDDAIKVEGYTAQEIASIGLTSNPAEAYTFLICLRENPVWAQMTISKERARKKNAEIHK